MSLRSVARILPILVVVAAGIALPVAASSSERTDPPARAADMEGFRSLSTAEAPISTATVLVPMAFPVIGGVSYTDTFLACRGTNCSRRHLGQDLMGGKLRPLVAAFSGTVSYLQRESTPGEGNILSIRSLDSQWSVNYIHINNDNPGTDDGKGSATYAFLPGLRNGQKVARGQLVAWMGDSGNAESTAPHLHFELRKGDAWSGTVFNPFASLNAAPRLPAALVAMPHQPGELVAHGTGWPSMIMSDGGRTAMSPSAMAVYALTADDVVAVSNEELAVYPFHGAAPLLAGSVVVSPGGTYWATTGGSRYAVTSGDLAGWGLPTTSAVPVTDEALVGTPVSTGPVPNGAYRQGAFIHEYGNPQMYRMDQGLMRPVHQGTWLQWHIPGARVGSLPVGTLSQYGAPSLGAVLTFKDGSIYRTTTTGTFMLVNGLRRQIVDLRGQVYYNWRDKRQYWLYDSVNVTLPLGSPIS